MWSGPVARDEELRREKYKGKAIPGVAGDLGVQSFQLLAGGNGQMPSRCLSELCCGGCWRMGLGCVAKKVGPPVHFPFFTYAGRQPAGDGLSDVCEG
jgi:hypothetical protein